MSVFWPVLWGLSSGCGGSGAAEVAPTEPGLRAPPPVHTHTLLSDPYHIDKKYMSMTGPWSLDPVTLYPSEKPELLWIVGYRTTVVKAEDGAELSQEFMCHANLDFDPNVYFRHFPTSPSLSGRVFTLSQGQQDIQFPAGFGIPVTSDLPITLATQVLNLNLEDPSLDVRHQVEIRFVRDAEVEGEMTPLFQAAVEGFKALGEAFYYGVEPDSVDPNLLGQGCSVGQAAIAGQVDQDPLGQRFTAHWAVLPGREENVTNVTRFLNLPYDTTAHYIAVHVHPFATRLSLYDRTANVLVAEAATRNATGRIGLDHIDHIESQEGIRFYKDHEYELVSVYENPLEVAVDSMAVMYLYLKDQRFRKPNLERPLYVATEPESESEAVPTM